MAIDFNLRSPADAITQGLLLGTVIRSAEQQVATQQADKQRQLQMQDDITTVTSKESPTASDYAKLTTKYPEFNEAFSKAWGMLDKDQQNNRITQVSNVYAALEAGKPDVAKQQLELQARAAENSGDQSSAKAARVMIGLIDSSPTTAKTSVALRLSSMMGPEEFTNTFTKLQSERREAALDPSKLTEAQAKAKKAAVEADFAESQGALDLQKKGWDIFKIQEDVKISKENSKIAALNANLTRESNAIKRDEMKVKLEELERGRDEAVRAKVADVESANSNIDNMLTTADRLLKVPVNVMESAMGPVASRLPTVSQAVADFEVLIENLDAQSFLAQIPNMKGLGALSDAEGKKLGSALQNFGLKQSPTQLIKNIQEAQRLLLKARSNISARHGVPETIPDTPEADTSSVDDLISKYGG